ncbi:hypothetical protein SARC_02939 [Sphaeroforma arctica JP610]|uniref:Uncharacterized protein n=1 Tax=Sphaeroforma arctica JP610 TaxID=667725 RepID=A0A0L0G742_9EUKA|nr:hypothetical protein SARC_02939 [Sphaeroforma arctica JP610]KNC84857.1 hypothetical protein SARC_02939 [Sphaeroforma arctica JP610]|eukprot:XP_014158759.1 hypothetical protein SARC_02939 [Sphaeroforma arctica JP610]
MVLAWLQTQIRSEKETVSDVISERNCMRQRCLAQIETALQNLWNDSRPKIGVRAVEALGKLCTRPPVPNSESQYVRDDRGLCRLCKDVCITGERFAILLGYNSSLRRTCDMVADNARKRFTDIFFREYECELADMTSERRYLERCFAGLAEELAFQRDSAKYVTKASILFGICVKIETALDALVRYCYQSIEMDAAYRRLSDTPC